MATAFVCEEIVAEGGPVCTGTLIGLDKIVVRRGANMYMDPFTGTRCTMYGDAVFMEDRCREVDGDEGAICAMIRLIEPGLLQEPGSCGFNFSTTHGRFWPN